MSPTVIVFACVVLFFQMCLEVFCHVLNYVVVSFQKSQCNKVY